MGWIFTQAKGAATEPDIIITSGEVLQIAAVQVPPNTCTEVTDVSCSCNCSSVMSDPSRQIIVSQLFNRLAFCVCL